jgi:hypothetical protein
MLVRKARHFHRIVHRGVAMRKCKGKPDARFQPSTSPDKIWAIRLTPKFSMSQTLVGELKKHGYKWVKYGTWILEKEPCVDRNEEMNFLRSFGDQRWETDVLPAVAKYDDVCEDCGSSRPIFVYDPLWLGAQTVGKCPRCKKYAVKQRNRTIIDRKLVKQWESEGEIAMQAIVDLMRKTYDKDAK